MSEALFRRNFDRAFLSAWGVATGGLSGTYTSQAGAETAVDVLVDPATDDFGDDLAPISYDKALVTLFLEQVSPETGGVVAVGSDTYYLVKRTPLSDDSRSEWVARRG
ncbi:hypothetical protein [Pseudoxanthomonas indica]|uniref:Uncharacterized protein n=1 Tax=Pseudoxanthomonas indica TaxID=428993 RepID=A0A1T5K0L2_9GAMM|nr:hypothetical protein [Pseudoxanthomonas indica]GGD45731.1 hypothetical protein GCM10007235_17080 [Pseudoxanthomonas indica]SKC57163.1 hypothetical protein SAMN06296058_1249 [Pseudoxanthomonas indica]